MRSGESSLDESMDTLELNGSNGGVSNWPITELAVSYIKYIVYFIAS
jgi:hypothetical protein